MNWRLFAEARTLSHSPTGHRVKQHCTDEDSCQLELPAFELSPAASDAVCDHALKSFIC